MDEYDQKCINRKIIKTTNMNMIEIFFRSYSFGHLQSVKWLFLSQVRNRNIKSKNGKNGKNHIFGTPVLGICGSLIWNPDLEPKNSKN